MYEKLIALLKSDLIRQLFIFGLVGTVGFVVDAGVLYGALALGLGYYGGRVISYLCAATVTWYLNRRFTFKATEAANKKKEWVRFLFLNLGGFAVNYGTYAFCIASFPLAQAYPVLAVAAGSIAGLFVNFGINKYLVFKN